MPKKKSGTVSKSAFIRQHPNLSASELVSLARESKINLTDNHIYVTRCHDRARKPTAKMAIEPTEFTRSDGIVMVRLPSGNWMLRRGPSCYFFDRTRNWADCWVFKTAQSIEDLEVFSMSLGEAYRILEVLPMESRASIRRSKQDSC